LAKIEPAVLGDGLDHLGGSPSVHDQVVDRDDDEKTAPDKIDLDAARVPLSLGSLDGSRELSV